MDMAVKYGLSKSSNSVIPLFATFLLPICRGSLAYVFIPIVQRDLYEFSTVVWKKSRGRKHKNKFLPTGIPDYNYHHPETYGGQKCGFGLTQQIIDELEDETKVF